MQSMPGRVVMAGFETLRATGASVVCLSPVCQELFSIVISRHTA